MNKSADVPNLVPNFIKSNNTFAFNLFQKIYFSKKEQNIFISPVSLAINLALLCLGSAGKTQQEILSALELDELQFDNINSEYQKLLTRLSYLDKKIELSVANSLWCADFVEFNPEFLEKAKTYYKAQVSNLDFKKSISKEEINNWVKLQTKEKILEIIDNLDPFTQLILLNAIYFKGEWTNKFDPQQTIEEIFHLSNGRLKTCSMMYSSEHPETFFTKNLSAARLPYGDKRLSLYLFLPDPKTSLEDFIKNLNVEELDSYFSQPWWENAVAIPKIKLDFSINLTDFLVSLGVKEAFSDKANFTPMTIKDEQLFVTQVIQKTFLEVNEEGSEAAAATDILTLATGIPSILTFDRPFFYFIRDNITELILFMGTLDDPSPRSKELSRTKQIEIEKEEKLKKELGSLQYTIHKEMEKSKVNPLTNPTNNNLVIISVIVVATLLIAGILFLAFIK